MHAKGLRTQVLLSPYSIWVTVASRLVRSTPDRAVQVQALTLSIMLCSWAKQLLLTVLLSTQVCK